MAISLEGIPSLYGTGLICGEDPGTMSGAVTSSDATPVEGVEVHLYRSLWADQWKHLTATETGGDGEYEFTDLGQGVGIDFRVQFVDPSHRLATQYYEDKPTIEAADVITITPGVPCTGIDAVLTANERVYLPLVLTND